MRRMIDLDTRAGRCGMAMIVLLLAAPARAEVAEPELSATSALVLHHRSGRVLWARNATQVRSIASLTKIVAALVVRARGLDLKRATRIERADHLVGLGGCRTRLQLRWTYRNHDLLRAALMASDNRAVSALGRSVELDARGLVGAMNAFVRRHGLRKTRFGNPVGITPDNVSTAWEMAQLIRLASQDPVLSRVMSTRSYRVEPVKGRGAILYSNTNTLLGQLAGVRFRASKTGYNRSAGYCFAATADIRGLGQTSIVSLGSRSKNRRIMDAASLLRWARRHGPALLSRSQAKPSAVAAR